MPFPPSTFPRYLFRSIPACWPRNDEFLRRSSMDPLPLFSDSMYVCALCIAPCATWCGPRNATNRLQRIRRRLRAEVARRPRRGGPESESVTVAARVGTNNRRRTRTLSFFSTASRSERCSALPSLPSARLPARPRPRLPAPTRSSRLPAPSPRRPRSVLSAHSLDQAASGCPRIFVQGGHRSPRFVTLSQATRGVKTLDFAGTKETVYERAGTSSSSYNPRAHASLRSIIRPAGWQTGGTRRPAKRNFFRRRPASSHFA